MNSQRRRERWVNALGDATLALLIGFALAVDAIAEAVAGSVRVLKRIGRRA